MYMFRVSNLIQDNNWVDNFLFDTLVGIFCDGYMVCRFADFMFIKINILTFWGWMDFSDVSKGPNKWDFWSGVHTFTMIFAAYPKTLKLMSMTLQHRTFDLSNKNHKKLKQQNVYNCNSKWIICSPGSMV